MRLTEEVEASEQVKDCTGNGFVITHSKTGCLNGKVSDFKPFLWLVIPSVTSPSCSFQEDPIGATWT